MRLFILLSVVSSACVGLPSLEVVPATDELVSHVEAIRQAEIAVQAVDDFLPCSDESSAKASTSTLARPWDGPDCFARLGWATDEAVRGGYFVTVEADKSDFTVVGVADTDGDGQYMRVEASKGQAAKVVSGEGIQ